MFKKLNYDEAIRKIRRLDGKLTYRKLFVIILVSCIFFLWILSRFFYDKKSIKKDALSVCIDENLTPRIYSELDKGNLNIYGLEHDKGRRKINDIPYVGNGIFGVEISQDAHFNIKEGRALLLNLPFAPIVSVAKNQENMKEVHVVDYVNGLVTRYQCFDDYKVKYQYYAHRNYPSVFVQEIQIKNNRNQIIDLNLKLPRIIGEFSSATSQIQKIQHGPKLVDYQVITGFVKSLGKIRVVSIVHRVIPRVLTLNKRGNTNLYVLTTINYSKPVNKDQFAAQKEIVEKFAINAMKKIYEERLVDDDRAGDGFYEFRKQHTSVWNNLWQTGFYLSESKAENSLNGDKINSTMYHVLSHARAYEFEESITPIRKNQILQDLTYSEGCYDSYHTLQAENLWKSMNTIENANEVVKMWMLTLEKQGCHNLIKAGASGVIQSMVLSFGGFRFSQQHLEFNIHPKYLHRDFSFRRLNYGNMTHVNVTITVREDNKAQIEVSLDRADRNYYACDAGCLDTPVKLQNQHLTIFPVKLTEPLTPILYITSDKIHMEDLRHAIHVKEVNEAPAHEHHLILLHKHGSNLGGLPTFFWIAICAIIVIFHIFLCRLIVKEYCDPPEMKRYRYSKP
ncbi:hypothetical protein PVAND_012770 [Polypedilum vanderplanki]|uniref:Uncharacterized protein n=1 Tax=Polypedilum vanderplanki TaxID=319348 RepID=A0A9J6CNF1_POLVA|nr:hypothetical protein PVAND_012770 [Polypedilum vanderplanki]